MLKLQEKFIVREEFDHWGVLVDPDNGRAVVLNPCALAICRLLLAGMEQRQIAAQLEEQFDNISETVEQEIDLFLGQLRQQGMLT